jgi:DDE superfamily endonuclease
MRNDVLSHLILFVCVFGCGMMWYYLIVCSVQRKCVECGHYYTVRAADRHHLCSKCNTNRIYQCTTPSNTNKHTCRLDEAGLYGRVAKKEFPFTEQHIAKRLSFVHTHINWKDDQWDRVLFSDESTIEMGPHGQVWVQRPLGAAYDPKYMCSKPHHPPSVHMWACFCGNGVGEIDLFHENLEQKKMKAILEEHLLSSSRQYFPSGEWWFLQDNDPKHSSRLVQHWLFNHGVLCMKFPPYSPDLNPIENLWNDLKRRVEKRNARDMAELEQHVKEEWSLTNQSFLSTLAHSMIHRCQAVVTNRGHKCAY